MDRQSRATFEDELAEVRSLGATAPDDCARAAERLLSLAQRLDVQVEEGSREQSPAQDVAEHEVVALVFETLRLVARTPLGPLPEGLLSLERVLGRLLGRSSGERVIDGVFGRLAGFRYMATELRRVSSAGASGLTGAAEIDERLGGYARSVRTLASSEAGLRRLGPPGWAQGLSVHLHGALDDARSLLDSLWHLGARRRGAALLVAMRLSRDASGRLGAPVGLQTSPWQGPHLLGASPARQLGGREGARSEGATGLTTESRGEPEVGGVGLSDLVLAERRLGLAGVTLSLFGSREELWYRAVHDAGATMDGPWTPVSRGSLGDDLVFPVAVDTPEPPPLAPFRPGRLRRLLRLSGANVDRAYAPRAYVLTVGTSGFKSIFGWGEDAERRLLAAARAAGCRSGTEVVEWLTGETPPLESAALRALPLARADGDGGLRMAAGDPPATLGQLLDRWAEVERWPTAWVELDSLDKLPEGGLRPVAGDRFALIPTSTAASILSALLLARQLAHALPECQRPTVHINIACRQRASLDDVRFDYADQPLQDTQEAVGSVLDRFLASGADPVVIATGGTKPLSFASCDACRTRRVTWIHKTELSAPLVVDWEWRQRAGAPGDARPALAEDAAPTLPRGGRWLVMPVGLRLLQTYQRETGRRGAEGFSDWTRSPGNARKSPEVTGFLAWRASLLAGEPLRVALLRSRDEVAGAAANAEEVERLLRDEGAEVYTRSSWDLEALPSRAGAPSADVGAIFERQALPVLRCLRAIQECAGARPDVFVMPGRKITGIVAHFAARQQGLRSLLSPEPEEAAEPVLWVLEASGEVVHHVYAPEAFPG